MQATGAEAAKSVDGQQELIAFVLRCLVLLPEPISGPLVQSVWLNPLTEASSAAATLLLAGIAALVAVC